MNPDLRDYLMLPVADLVPYARNARTHSPEQVAQIVASIREFGWTNPVLVDGDGGIIAGHGRVLAAQQMGTEQVPCLRIDGLTDVQRRAYMLADNQITLNAGWDGVLLAAELDDLLAAGFDLATIGFAQADINDLIGTPNTGPPGAEEANQKLADRFMIPPFSVLNAREGWWQDRKRAWLALGIKSELGRGGGADDGSRTGDLSGPQLLPRREQSAAPGGSARPAADYSKRQRGNGAGRAL